MNRNKSVTTPKPQGKEDKYKMTVYGAFLLFLLTSIRSIFIVNEQAIGYAYGYQGVGAQANGNFMLSKAMPGITPVYGLVASALPQLTYAVSNLIVAPLSGKWNKRKMLAIGVLGFSAAHMV